MSCENYTVTFDEKVKGWTSFHSFIPDNMLGMNNRFFSFVGGNIYEHHSDEVDRNTYYGLSYPSKISAIFNDSPSEIKELQAISLEGNYSWEALITAYVSNVDDFTQSSIQAAEFVKKEGIWYAYARRNEDITHTNSRSTYGIGRISQINLDGIIVNGFSCSLVEGDELVNGNDLSIIGTITSLENRENGLFIGLDDTSNALFGSFIIGRKNPRIEGGNLRGYATRIDLEIENPTKVELFAVNSEVMKSYS